MNKKLDVSLVWNKSWEVFKENWERLSLLYFGISLVVFVLGYVAPCQPPTGDNPEANLVWLMEGAATYYLYTLLVPGLVQVVLTAFFYKKILSVTKDVDIELSATIILRFVVVTVIVGVLTFISFLCCLIPMFFIAPRLMLAPLYTLDNPNMGIGEAIGRSWKATKGNILMLWVLGLLAFAIGFVGVLCCGVGVIPAGALNYTILVVTYLVLSGQDGTPQNDSTPQEESFVIEEKSVCRD